MIALMLLLGRPFAVVHDCETYWPNALDAMKKKSTTVSKLFPDTRPIGRQNSSRDSGSQTYPDWEILAQAFECGKLQHVGPHRTNM